ncbi:DUF262 domain-containing protein [Rahnella aquatilis]|jgi:hypothetical protein|uniref:DUF262 domain-containing protein n=1 Tax=Rahnella aquatilis TaxID=34038 RepID=UPI00064595C9|nr:DUF262 domain-containing protein [Rahnella aquatilis]
MNLKELLNDIFKLIGLTLAPVNSNSGTITLIELDKNSGKYYVKPVLGKKVSRNIYEFEHILRDLIEFGYANVESSLGGSGSSRHHPETILSNLPYIEHFKYKNKKHILLLEKPTHDLGTLKETSGVELRKVKAALTAKENLNYYDIHRKLFQINSQIKYSLQEVSTKYPGEIRQEGIAECLQSLSLLEENFSQIFFKTNKKSESLIEDSLPSSLQNYNDTNKGSEEDSDNEDIDDNDDSEKINYDRKNLKIRQLTMSFSLIYDRIQYNEIELQPDFQRKERVWSQKEKSLLIESILLGLPIPMFYFAERENGTWLIVDGLQRTTTIFDYMRGKFILTDLKYFNDPNDSVYKRSFQDLPRQYQRKIREYQINGHLISVEKNDFEMVRELFQRINTYGRALSPQEIRCALNPGSSIPFIRYLAETPNFIDSTFNKVNPKRMKDMEYVLGIISFILFGYRDYKYNREDDFLVFTMKYLNKYNFKLIGSFSDEEGHSLPEWENDECSSIFYIIFEKFKKGILISNNIFGSKRFKKINSPSINKQLLIMMVSVFALIDNDIVDEILAVKDDFTAKFDALISGDIPSYVNWISDSYNESDKDFDYAISQSTGKRATILYRFENFISLIQDVTNKKVLIEGIINHDDQ